MEALIEIIRAIRNARAEHKVESTRWVSARIYTDELINEISPYAPVIEALARARPVAFFNRRQERPQGDNNLVTILKDATVAIPLESMVDLESERQRLKKEIAGCERNIAGLEPRLTNRDFLNKAPTAVIDKERDKLATQKTRMARLKEQLKSLG